MCVEEQKAIQVNIKNNDGVFKVHGKGLFGIKRAGNY